MVPESSVIAESLRGSIAISSSWIKYYSGLFPLGKQQVSLYRKAGNMLKSIFFYAAYQLLTLGFLNYGSLRTKSN